MRSFSLTLKPFYRALFSNFWFLYRFGFGPRQRELAIAITRRRTFPLHSDGETLSAALAWLKRAQDICAGNGVSAAFYLSRGWDVAYPETSGYIAASLLAYGRLTKDPSFIERAVQIGDWEIEIQTEGGGVLSRPTRTITRVFNTGQVILGWCSLFEATGEQKYLDAAMRAGDYLLKNQEADGTWKKDTYCGPRTYHARVDWALLRLTKISGEIKYRKRSLKNISWIMKQAKPNGWFSNCGFHNELPNMHVISYTLRGLLECCFADESLDRNLEISPALIKAAGAICEAAVTCPVENILGMIPSSFDRNWNTIRIDSCLTGNAQFACFLYRLSQFTNDKNYAESAHIIVTALKKTLIIDSLLPDISGALAGSFPLYSGYMNQSWPNWATKFLSDAIMMKNNFNNGFTIAA